MDGTNFVAHLSKYVGETVTVFTKSGGESGSGFTGVLLAVNSCYIRIVVKFGPAPACALGNSCTGSECDPCVALSENCCDSNKVGAAADIPISAIVAFVHNAVQ